MSLSKRKAAGLLPLSLHLHPNTLLLASIPLQLHNFFLILQRSLLLEADQHRTLSVRVLFQCLLEDALDHGKGVFLFSKGEVFAVEVLLKSSGELTSEFG